MTTITRPHQTVIASSRSRVWLPVRMLLLCAATLVACAALASPATAVTNGFGVMPLRYDIKVAGGSSKSFPITVYNSYSTRAAFTVSTQDFAGSQSDPYAAPVFLGGIVDSPMSGARWLKPSTSSFSLDPGASKTVDVRVDVPSGAKGGHYAAVMVSSPMHTVSSDLRAKSRVAVLFLMNAGDVPPPELVIDDVYVNDSGNVIVDFHNEGDVATRPKGTVIYTDPVTGKKLSAESKRCRNTVLPGAAGRCVLNGGKGDGSALRRGEVELIGEHGGRASAGMPVEWSGSMASLLLPLSGLALLIFYFAFLRRWRREEQDEYPLAP